MQEKQSQLELTVLLTRWSDNPKMLCHADTRAPVVKCSTSDRSPKPCPNQTRSGGSPRRMPRADAPLPRHRVRRAAPLSVSCPSRPVQRCAAAFALALVLQQGSREKGGVRKVRLMRGPRSAGSLVFSGLLSVCMLCIQRALVSRPITKASYLEVGPVASCGARRRCHPARSR